MSVGVYVHVHGGLCTSKEVLVVETELPVPHPFIPQTHR